MWRFGAARAIEPWWRAMPIWLLYLNRNLLAGDRFDRAVGGGCNDRGALPLITHERWPHRHQLEAVDRSAEVLKSEPAFIYCIHRLRRTHAPSMWLLRRRCSRTTNRRKFLGHFRDTGTPRRGPLL